MKIYRVNCLLDSYQSLEQDYEEPQSQEEGAEFLRRGDILRRGQPVTEPLTPPEVFSRRPKLPSPDFWMFQNYSALAMPPETVEKVRPFLGEAGELLPLPYKSKTFSVLNVLRCVEYEIFPEKIPGRLLREQAADTIPLGLFRAIDRTYLYVSEATGDPDTEFKAFVEREKMTGLKFLRVWDSEAPDVEIK